MEAREGTVLLTPRPQSPAPELREDAPPSPRTGVWCLRGRRRYPTRALGPRRPPPRVAVRGGRKPHPGTRGLSSLPPKGPPKPHPKAVGLQKLTSHEMFTSMYNRKTKKLSYDQE